MTDTKEIALHAAKALSDKKGLGIQLLGYVVLYARKHGINLLRLGFEPADERGAAFARDKGFVPGTDGLSELRLG